MPKGNNQYLQERGVPKQAIRWDKNVGGVNFGVIDDMLQTFECANIKNLDIDPICAYRKRDGIANLWPPIYGTRLVTITHVPEVGNQIVEEFESVDRTGQNEFLNGAWHWVRPGGTEHVLFFCNCRYVNNIIELEAHPGLCYHGGFHDVPVETDPDPDVDLDEIYDQSAGFNFLTTVPHGIILKESAE